MSTDNTLQKQAQSFIRAGFSLFQQVSQQQRNDSSDEETEGADSEEYINNGQRGIVVFKTYSVKSDRVKILHLNLYKAQIVQYCDSRKRTYQCEDIQSITRNSDNNVVIEIKKNMNLQVHVKKIIFETDQMAHQFHQYIEFINESGKCTKSAFNQMDYKRTGIISCPDLRRALARVDLPVSEQDIINMMNMGTGKDGVFDYSDFLHLFFNSFVSNLRQCLQEWLIQATTSSNDSTSSLAKVDTSLDAISGEVIAFAPTERVHWCVMGGKHCKYPQHIPGVMYATNYRIVLFALRKASNEGGNHSRFDVPSFFNMLSIPLTTLQRIYFAPPRNSIYFVCKDYRTVRVTLSGFENSKNKVETFVQVLQGMAFYNVHSLDPKSHLFAYKNLTYFSSNELGWNLCDVVKEYARQGLFDTTEWKVLENKEFSLADTYPRYLALPALMTKDEIRIAAGFRSKARLPVITYLHKTTGAVLTRSAQPMVGLSQKNCPEDEKLLRLYRCKGKRVEPNSEEDAFSRLFILDARGKVAATLNMAMGKGTEDISYYQNTELIFCNIDNIHVMRSSANAFADALSASASYTQSARDREGQLLLEGSMAGYYARLEESGWLRHTRLILMASVLTAEKLHFDGCSVLVHCSDGWDRTAQMCALAQILLDPYFRTIEGIATLVEKEWCAFGHKFQDRCGHGQDFNHLPDERSPVFLQFLDALYQVVAQFPTAFEYTDGLLLFLADHVSSCLFGNFLGNSEKERVEVLEVRMLTKSIWSYLFSNRDRFLNGSYRKFDKPLWPNCGAASMRVWERYWLRWDSSAHPNNLGEERWHDDWGKGTETDPAHVVTRSSYSFVGTRVASVKRPTGMRGLTPTLGGESRASFSSGSSAAGGDQQPQTSPHSETATELPSISPIKGNGTTVTPTMGNQGTNGSSAEDKPYVPAQEVTIGAVAMNLSDYEGISADPEIAETVYAAPVRAADMVEVTESTEGDCEEDAEETGPAEAAISETGTELQEDDEEDFQVLTDHSAASALHRAARVKKGSIEGSMLPDFDEVYDSEEHLADTPPPVETETLEKTEEHTTTQSTAVASEGAGSGADGALPYSYPPSGKDVAFI